MALAPRKRAPTIRFRYASGPFDPDVRDDFEMIEGWTRTWLFSSPNPLPWRSGILDLLLFFGLPALALGLYWLHLGSAASFS